MRVVRALAGFSRPHTVLATSVQVATIYLIVVGLRPLTATSVAGLALTLLACLALNLYVVGLNQITDVAIDRVNKPYLPLAAELLRPAEALGLVAAAGALALALAALLSPFLLLTVALIGLIGSAYSLPPARLKRFPLPAALSIAVARGFLANLGLALHYRALFGGDVPLATLALLGVFFFGFGLVIAIYKDMPDAEGDRLHKIETLTTRLGPRRVLDLGRAVLSSCYAIPILFAAVQLPAAGALFLLLSHAAIIALFWAVSARVDVARNQSIAGFYMFLWGLFYAEFVVLSIYELTRTVV